jgi:hypothetical protein
MELVGEMIWSKVRPPSHDKNGKWLGCYFGAWTDTLLTEINKAGATLFKYTCRDKEMVDRSVPRKIVAHTTNEKIINALPYYNADNKMLSGRFIVELNSEIDENTINVIYGEYYVRITLVDEVVMND